jgi:putative membrane protein
MPPKLTRFLLHWIVNTAAVLVASCIVKGIRYDKPLDLLAASLLLGILNAFVRPVLKLLSLPLLILTLGLFSIVINALLLYIVGWLLYPKFSVANFGAALWGALIIAIVSVVLNILTGANNTRIQVRRSPPAKPHDDDSGPVIDV